MSYIYGFNYRFLLLKRSSSPGNNVYKFTKDNEAKVRKKTSKINNCNYFFIYSIAFIDIVYFIAYRTIISNFIYNFTHLPLKVSMSKLRNRIRLKNTPKSQKAKHRNDIFFKNTVPKCPGNLRRSTKRSDCSINSVKCANFMCAKSTAQMLLQQRDLLCNIKTEICIKDEKPKEIKTSKSEITKPINVEKEVKCTVKAKPVLLKKNIKPLGLVVEDKPKPNENKRKLNKSEAVVSSTELKRLKRLLHSSDEIRNYKIDQSPPGPIRMDSVMGTAHLPKKLPELPIQIMPKVEQICPKQGPILITPKRKYTTPEMTRNYKPIENAHQGSPRMDNLVGRRAASRDRSSNTKRFYESSPLNSKQTVFPSELDQAANDFKPNIIKPAWTSQQLNKANTNVSEKIKILEELIKCTDPHIRSKTKGPNPRLHDPFIQSKEMGKHDVSSPKLSPYAIADIYRKYYPSETFQKDTKKAAPMMEKNNNRADAKQEHLHSMSKKQNKNLNENTLDIYPNNNIKLKHAKIRDSVTNNSDVVKKKDVIYIEDNKSDFFGDCSTYSAIETSATNIIRHKVLIPPPSKSSSIPENKRNYSSTAIYEYKESLNGCPDLLNGSFNLIKSNLCDRAPSAQGLFSTNIKKQAEINSMMSRAKKRNKLKSNRIQQDFDNFKQDRRFSSDNFSKNVDDLNDYTRDLNKSQRNLSKSYCTTEVTSTLDNQDGTLPPENENASYEYHNEQNSFSTKVNDYEVEPINLHENEYGPATLVINADEIINERYVKMLIDKKALIKNYIQWKTQLHKFGNLTKKCKPSKCCLQLMNKVYKQNKFKLRKTKAIPLKQKFMSHNNFPVKQEQNELVDSTISLIKSQVAHKCVMFDKISDALLKKTDIIIESNHTKKDVRGNEGDIKNLRHNKKRKLSHEPELENWIRNIILSPEFKIKKSASERNKVILVKETKSVNPVQKAKHVVQEVKNIQIQGAKNVVPIPESKIAMSVSEAKIVIPVPNTNNDIEYMDVDMPSFQTTTSALSTRSREEICNKNIGLKRTIKIKPPAIPATLKAKKFLANIDAEPKQLRNILLKKIKHQKSTRAEVLNSDKIGKYIAYV